MFVRCDRKRLLQALSNLIGNAVKFTPAGGTVTVALTQSAAAVVFEVTEPGPGIPAEQLPHIFDRYWRARTQRTQGVGLGLSITKAVLDAHGATLTVESSLGHGALFRFSLEKA